jgi:hypothetical protein
MIDEWNRGQIEALPRHLPEGDEEKQERSVRVAGGPRETLTEHLPNTSLEWILKGSDDGVSHSELQERKRDG